ncbi:MAG: signal peptidase II [Pseudomonadota bacterium]
MIETFDMPQEKTRRKISGIHLLIIVLCIVVFDQITKFQTVNTLELGERIVVFTGFDLWHVHNYGAAFSFLNDAGGWQRWVLTGVSLIASLVLAWWLVRLPKTQRLLAVALAVLLAGAVGNLIDRFFFGYVVDFISVYYADWRFATFNIADAAISIGAALLVLDILLGVRSDDRQ